MWKKLKQLKVWRNIDWKINYNFAWVWNVKLESVEYNKVESIKLLDQGSNII